MSLQEIVVPELAAHVLSHLARNAAMQAPHFTHNELAASMSHQLKSVQVYAGVQWLIDRGYVVLRDGYIMLSATRVTPVAKSVADAGNLLQYVCHTRSKERGWWNHSDGQPLLGRDWSGYVIGTKLMLMVSEIAEGMEGDRKNKMDDHLPLRKSLEVELADAVIRIADLAGAMGFDLGGAISDKLAYNAKRADHDPANRAQAGGKKY